jgi:hypothetical protein
MNERMRTASKVILVVGAPGRAPASQSLNMKNLRPAVRPPPHFRASLGAQKAYEGCFEKAVASRQYDVGSGSQSGSQSEFDTPKNRSRQRFRCRFRIIVLIAAFFMSRWVRRSLSKRRGMRGCSALKIGLKVDAASRRVE